MTITERAGQTPVERAVERMRAGMRSRGRARIDQQTRERRLQSAEDAYERWEAAVEAGLPHHEVSVRWDSYLGLARLAAE